MTSRKPHTFLKQVLKDESFHFSRLVYTRGAAVRGVCVALAGVVSNKRGEICETDSPQAAPHSCFAPMGNEA